MYGYGKQVNLDFSEAIEKVRIELEKEGFGVLTEIDVKKTLKVKLGVDFDKYIILGACNPPFAHKALSTEIEIGLLLPCNVIVYEKESKRFVSIILPTQAMNMVKDETLQNIAIEIESKLKKVIDRT